MEKLELTTGRYKIGKFWFNQMTIIHTGNQIDSCSIYLNDDILDKHEHGVMLPVHLFHPLSRVIRQRSVHRNTRYRSAGQM